ncbi:MAG TPA: MmgE/PrpD family protein [Candidatus Dormibacteraeota bacterium]|nr:MmgE/PrpD family protein [Candidatus Dormibacteraeota bacterium]
MRGHDASEVERLAAFVHSASWERITIKAREALKLRILDSLGCAIAALDSGVVRAVRREVGEMGGRPLCTLIGGGRTSPDRAAFHNAAAVRYLDFNDSFMAPGETCHPSDNLGPVLAAVEFAGGDGRDLLVSLAVAYQVQCRLSELAPVRARGFDHVTQGAYAVAAGTARGLGLDAAATANAIAIAGTAFNALRVTRTGSLSNWKGLAYPNTAFGAVHAAFLARAGITGPAEVFEGNKGFMESIAGHFSIDWTSEGLDAVTRTSIKRFNAEFHSQAVLEAVLELRQEHGINQAQIGGVTIEVFQVAYDIIGGGEEGDKRLVRSKEEADHSLPYLVAVALLDGQVLPPQFAPDRIVRADVQELLRRIVVRPDPELSARFPEQHACRVHIRLRDGRTLTREKSDYLGFITRPAGWSDVGEKFRRLVTPVAGESATERISQTVRGLEHARVEQLCSLLEGVGS